MILKGASFCIAEDKSKGEVDFKHSRLISEDTAQLFAEGSWTDCGQAKIVPILKLVLAAKSGSQCCLYMPAISVSLLGTRFEGIRMGSASQLEPAVAVDV